MIEAGPCLQSILNIRLYILSACLGAALAFTASASAQSEDEVHVVPRPGTMEASERATDTGRPLGSTNHLKLRPERLRVDVDVVLVPVVVTDTLNRPVTGLTKDSFELLDDGEKQKIHFFSLEDGALSVFPAHLYCWQIPHRGSATSNRNSPSYNLLVIPLYSIRSILL